MLKIFTLESLESYRVFPSPRHGAILSEVFLQGQCHKILTTGFLIKQLFLVSTDVPNDPFYDGQMPMLLNPAPCFPLSV